MSMTTIEIGVKGVCGDRRGALLAGVANSSRVPKEDDVRGRCPECSAPLDSRIIYYKDAGYILVWGCVNGDCNYERVL